jgi:hypothetical protein
MATLQFDKKASHLKEGSHDKEASHLKRGSQNGPSLNIQQPQ